MPYTAAESRRIFQTEVVEQGEGQESDVRGTTCVDKNMVEAASMPFHPEEQHASRWMKTFFSVYGDHSPCSEQTKISVTYKQDVYDKYVHSLSNENDKLFVHIPTNPRKFLLDPAKSGFKAISKNRFYTLWKELFAGY